MVNEIRRLNPDYSAKKSMDLWNMPYQELVIGYLEEDDEISLRFSVVRYGEGPRIERRDFIVPPEFAEKRGLSGKRGLMDAACGLVAYATESGDIEFDVIKYPYPKDKE